MIYTSRLPRIGQRFLDWVFVCVRCGREVPHHAVYAHDGFVLCAKCKCAE